MELVCVVRYNLYFGGFMHFRNFVAFFCIFSAFFVFLGCSSGEMGKDEIEDQIYSQFIESSKKQMKAQLPYLYRISPESQDMTKEEFIKKSMKAMDTIQFDSFTITNRKKIGEEKNKERVEFIISASMEKDGNRQSLVKDKEGTAMLTKKDSGWTITSVK
ncbi:hypothetical protein [Desulfohalobium retbaense]|uniref:DUF4878 domain-containing protein n=1 Tax=Desulfohalobium retbaense (strain ATCC 49708 / DSM 5692 / JCM 16813 / HR100) TaxID=485915 RepID=C8X5U5_DESRD|nr:hypothetical protein [Desulfohalobium retbaense]ACV69792.1 hypothetical protein Dret_2512 [Desulfohalobium retbaense DSM 5692]